MFVIDASALAKSFLQEARSDELCHWLEAAVAQATPIHAPAFVASELGRIIQKELDLELPDQKELWQAALAGIELAPPDVEDAGVWEAARNLTFYDAEYVDLASRLEATLVTADRRQAEAALSAGLDVLDFAPLPNA